ncbi:leucine-rich repeat-containing protein 45-like [Ciona intestinalis]
MDETFTLFVRLCKEHGIIAQESIINRLRELSHGSETVLDLSNHTLTIETCAVLGKVIAHDLAITSVLLSDCMLDEEGAKLLLAGLAENTVVRVLDLRGNNLRQVATVAIGNFLKKNQTLEALFLEWNSIGIWESSFLVFCEGLSFNSSLQHLDLRNNKIDHTGAKELAIMLRNNTALHTLDLRWNNLGLVGGRALVDALRQNTSIVKIDASGNNIPRDVMTSLENEAIHNEDKVRLSTNTYVKTKTLSKEIDILKSENKQQLVQFLNEMELKNSQMNVCNDSNKKTINHLQDTLDERKSALNALRAKLDLSETSLQLSDEKLKDQTLLLEISRKENVEISTKFENQIKQEREQRSQLENKLHKELEDTQDKMNDYRTKLIEVERKYTMQSDQVTSLKQQVAELKSEHSVVLLDYDTRMEKERKAWNEEMKSLKSTHANEVVELRSRMEEIRKSEEARNSNMRMRQDALANELSELNAKLVQERSNHDDELRLQRARLKEEEQAQASQLQEKIRSLMSENSENLKQISLSSSKLEEAHATKVATDIELDGVRRILNTVQRQLSNKDADTEEKISHVRQELNKRIEQLMHDSTQCSVLREKVTCLEKRLEDQAASNKDSLQEKEKIIDHLREQLRMTKSEMERVKEDELLRATSLQNAILSYVQGVKKSSSTTNL